jgi:hypothetical protein
MTKEGIKLLKIYQLVFLHKARISQQIEANNEGTAAALAVIALDEIKDVIERKEDQ